MKLHIDIKATLKKSMLGVLSAGLSVIATQTALAESAGTSPGAHAQAQAMENYDQAGYPIYPKPDYSKGDRKLIERGEYLTKAGDCMACHTDTKNHGKPFAGGLGIKTPFGTFYSPNLTPDKATGIGNWSDEDFIRAMHDGKAPNGSNYFPVFPYVDFNKITKEDLLAIKAYLFSLAPVQQENKKNDVPFPFSWRFLQYGWKLLFFYPDSGTYQYDNSKSAEWNRGAYLVKGLGHCGMCHTPINMLGAPKKAYYLTGNIVEGYYAANITKKGLGDATKQDIVNVFKHDQLLKGRGKVSGPMAEVNHDSLRYMSDEDLNAIAAFLLTVESKQPKVASSTGKVSLAEGKKIYSNNCAACHTTGSAGAPKLGDATAWDSLIKLGKDTVYQHAINGINSMPPKGGCMTCSENQIKAAVDYLISAAQGGEVVAKKPKPIPKLTLEDGKRIYEKGCKVCHQNGDLGAPKLGDQAAWAPRIAQNMDVLFTHSIQGYKGMPKMGACYQCSQAEVIAAVKYMAQESNTGGDYSLW